MQRYQKVFSLCFLSIDFYIFAEISVYEIIFLKILVFFAAFGSYLSISAQSCSPYGVFLNEEGTVDTLNSVQGFSGSAPLKVSLVANPTNNYPDGTHFEWHFLNKIILSSLFSPLRREHRIYF